MKAITLNPRVVFLDGWDSRRGERPALDADGLLDSIRVNGILTPPCIRQCGTGQCGPEWRLVSGHRRVLAAIQLGIGSVLFAVLEADDFSAACANFVENAARSNLVAWQRADALSDLVAQLESAGADHAGAVSEVARRLAQTGKHVAAHVRIRRRLCPELWAHLVQWGDTAKVGWHALAEIARLDTPEAQVAEWKKQIDEAEGTRRRGRERKAGPAKLGRILTALPDSHMPKQWRAGAEWAIRVARGEKTYRQALSELGAETIGNQSSSKSEQEESKK